MSQQDAVSGQVVKWVYKFEEGSAAMRDMLGGKGAGVAEMTRVGLPVPPGFTIITEACRAYLAQGERFPDGLKDQVVQSMKELEKKTGKIFGDPTNPLLVSVRSGAKFSMPGMMDTILNLGLNDLNWKGLATQTQNERFALDAYRRFIQMFGKTVMGIPGDKFEEALRAAIEENSVDSEAKLPASALEKVVEKFKAIYRAETGSEFPQDVWVQLYLAIEAVFKSWNNKRAIDYRNLYGIPHDLGTAVNVQVMVFGNMGEDSGTGVAFTRDPNTGEKVLYGEYLPNAQGEDVVSGTRTPLPIQELESTNKELYVQLKEIAQRLERHYKDMQDIEFTVERGKLYLLQTRSAKRTAQAAVKIAVDMVREGLIDKKEAILRVEPEQVEQLLHWQIDRSQPVNVIARGVAASPGAATGKVVLDADTAERMGKDGEAVILVRPETNPDDVHGIIAAKGVLTARGGKTSHAAVVTRGLGKPCVTGCEAIAVYPDKGFFEVDGQQIHQGEVITIDGTTGEVILGEVSLVEPKLSSELQDLLLWADEIKKLEVWANADYPRDAKVARDYGARGIGLCRTEHMFMEQDRLPIVQKMILSETRDEREKYLAQLLPFQREDFKGILSIMEGLPVVIRLIDPPLHEFLPSWEETVEKIAQLKAEGKTGPELEELEQLKQRIESMREFNPMLGLRGCRLGLLYPEIIEMQVRAIMEASCELKASGHDVRPEIMVPLVGTRGEMEESRKIIQNVAEKVMDEKGVRVEYKIGTMIEVPRAALTAGEIAKAAEFFSFGTNDLTQTTFGYSRDDAEGKFIPRYLDLGILSDNPFETLDPDGVARLMRIAVQEGKATRPNLEVGICGEHGGDPRSIYQCHHMGLNYVSCSPYRVPVARIAVARAAIEEQKSVAMTA